MAGPKISKNTKFRLFLAALLMLAVLAAFQLLHATRWGLWAYSDSAAYMGTARSLAQGRGFILPLAGGGFDHYEQFPPLYPLLISMLGSVSGDFFQAARWLNVVACSLFIFLSGVTVYSTTKKTIPSLAAPILLLVSPMMITDFSGAMTEAVFLALLLLNNLALIRCLKADNTVNRILLIAAAALLPVTRYIGIAALAVNAILLIGFAAGALRRRLVNTVIITAASLLPLAVWTVYSYSTTAHVGGRGFALNPQFLEWNLRAVFEMARVFRTFLPYLHRTTLVFPLAVAGYALLVLVSTVHLWRAFRGGSLSTRDAAETLQLPLLALAFVLFISLSYSITLGSFRIDDRQLSPLIPMLVISSLILISVLLESRSTPAWLGNVLVFLVFGLLFRYYWYQSRPLVNRLHAEGRGYAQRQYLQSGILPAIRAIPPEIPIISNTSGFTLYYDQRLALQVERFLPQRFGSGSTNGEREFREQGAALLLLIPDFYTDHPEDADWLYPMVTEGLRPAYQDEVSAIFYYPD